MGDDEGAGDSARQPRAADERLLPPETPGAGVDRWVQGQDGECVLLDQLGKVGRLVGVPAVVHHDLDPVEAGLGGPREDPLQPEGVERARAEDDRYAQARPRRISTKRSRVEGERFW